MKFSLLSIILMLADVAVSSSTRRTRMGASGIGRQPLAAASWLNITVAG
jgi:hypothetical protein